MYKKSSLLLFLLTFILFNNIAAERSACLPACTVGRSKVGLVLAGGGAKGFAHIAVLEMLEEMEIPIDLIIGVSAGSIVGGLYSAGYSPEMIKDALMYMDWTSLFTDAPVLPFENELDSEDFLIRYSMGQTPRGVSPGQEAYNLFKALTIKIPSYIDFDDLPIPFRAGAAEMSQNKFDLLDRGDLAEAIRASMSLPGVFDSFDIDGKRYIDGGILNNLPIRMAKEMGCDIIIASELSFEIMDLTDNPLKVPDLILSLYGSVVSSEQYDLADLLIKHDLLEFSIMDFPKSQEIYSLANAQRDSILGDLARIKEQLLIEEEINAQSFIPAGSYRELPYITPDFLTITGAHERDRKYIENYWTRHLKGNILKEESITDFIDVIYKTGNYRFAAARIDTRQNNTILELRLYPENYKKTNFLLGGYYHGTFSRDSMHKMGLTAGVQLRGLSGPGSMLSFTASMVHVLSLGILYLQPLSTKTFATARIDAILDQHISASGFLTADPKEERSFFLSGEINGGYLIDRYNMFKAGVFISAVNLHKHSEGLDRRNTAAGFSAAFSHNNLDSLFFPSKGIYAVLENRFYMPLPFKEPMYFDIITLDFQGGFPLNRGFSISAGAFAGSDLSSNLSGLDNLDLGFTASDRLYFPNISVIDHYYSNKLAASLALQLQPLKDIVILGGQVFFALSVSAGGLFDKPEDFNSGSIIWNTSLNAGVRLRSNFGLLLRVGMGRNGSEPLKPFLAFDIGRIPRSGIRPGR